MKKTLAIYPGTFDPVTFGHLDILKRASKMFDNVIIAVVKHSSKKTLFTVDERLSLIKETTKDLKNVKADSFDGLLVDYAKKTKANVIVRGLRVVSDFEYEFQMALTNKKLEPSVETVFLTPDEKYIYLSSTLIREIALNGGNVSAFVPGAVVRKLKLKS